MPNKDGGWLLPEEIDPERIQFCISIPNDLNHIIAFWGALLELTRWWNWQRDDDHTALLVTEVWRQVIEDAQASYIAGDCLQPPQCRVYSPRSPRLAWHPVSPYDTDAAPPDGYPHLPWTVVDNSILGTIISMWGLGYQVGDVYTDLTKIPSGSWSDLIITWEFFPRFEVLGLTGTGTVKLHLLNIPQGGRLFLVKDGVIDLLALSMIETNKDGVSFPPETQVPFIVEVEFTSAGDHTLQCAFLPTVDDTPIPIFFGGGLRQIEICGFEGNMSFDPCCPDSIEQQTITNQLLRKIITMISDGFKVVPLTTGAPPDMWIDDKCSPPVFDLDPDDDETQAANRLNALCYTIYWYVVNVFYKSMSDSFVPLEYLSALFPSLNPLLPSLGRLEAAYWSEYSVSGFVTSFISNKTQEITCAMLANLIGKTNTLKHFQNSLTVPEGASAADQYQYEQVIAFNQKYVNWKRFSEALSAAIDVEGIDTYECGCEEVTDPLVLIDPNTPEFHNTVITPLGGNLYQVTQDIELTPGNYPVTLQDSECRQINVISVGDQPSAHWYKRGSDCTTIEDDGTGGFSGLVYQIGLDYVDPLDSIFHITLA